jgi:SAM-dependent methyltransferase
MSEAQRAPAPEGSTNPYNTAPYPLLAYADAHPARMAAIARLMELPVADVETARVLEIGSAVGGHLLPMAMALPRAHFTGVDLAEEQVAQANRYARELGLANIEFVQANIVDYQPEPGSFDFVIAHGIYSWVAPEVRDPLLGLVARALAPAGLGYVSYNTFPGWHGLMAVRRILELGAGELEDPVERARAGVANIDLVRGLLSQLSPMRPLLAWYDPDEGDRFRMAGVDHLVLITHDELSEYNDPIYFLDFVAHASSHGLEHVADADISASFPHGLTAEQIERINKQIRHGEEFEQYLDFVHNRTFRRSLLVHSGRQVNRRLQANPDNLRDLWVRTRATVEGQASLQAGDKVAFVAPNEARIVTEHALSKAAFLEAIEASPAELGYDELVTRAAQRTDVAVTEQEERMLAGTLLTAFTYSSELLDLRAAPARITTQPGERPRVDPYVRWMAARRETLLTNRFFDRVPIQPVVGLVLSLLDGTRTVADVALAAADHLEPGGGQESDLPKAVAEVVDFARWTGLLVRS